MGPIPITIPGMSDICGVFASTHHPGGQLERVGGEIVGVKGVYTHWECHYSEFFGRILIK